MSDIGNIELLKTRILADLNNSVPLEFITPDKHRLIIEDLLDTIAPTFGSATGTDAYEVVMNITQMALDIRKTYLVSFLNTNTAASTLNVDTLGAKDLLDADNQPLTAGSIIVGKIYTIIYNPSLDSFVLR